MPNARHSTSAPLASTLVAGLWFARNRGDGLCVRILQLGTAADLQAQQDKSRRYKVRGWSHRIYCVLQRGGICGSKDDAAYRVPFAPTNQPTTSICHCAQPWYLFPWTALLTREYHALGPQVVVKTSDKKGAGTDANVFLTLYGSAGTSPPLRLESSANNFEKGRTDIFEVEASVGQIKFIRIGHDNTSLAPAWHLQARPGPAF